MTLLLGIAIAYFVIGGCVSAAVVPCETYWDASDRVFAGTVALLWPFALLLSIAYVFAWLAGKAVGR
jgi:hypothetical protein